MAKKSKEEKPKKQDKHLTTEEAADKLFPKEVKEHLKKVAHEKD